MRQWILRQRGPGRLAVVLAVTAALGIGAGIGAGVVASTPAAAYPSSSIALEGHGYGHGHGMGQWGALGYALAQTTYQAIVGHFYGGTTLASLTAAQEATQVQVAISENDNNPVIVTSGSPFTVAGTIPVAAGQAAMMSEDPAGGWDVSVSGGCAGPWPTAAGTGLQNPTAVPSSNPGLGDPATATKALQLCQVGGNLTVRGDIKATENSNGAARTVNILPLEQYVAGVVPNESPADWGYLGGSGPQGQAWGFQELEAQAVAARSYVMAGLGSYYGYADICDLACQSYRGVTNETSISDLAVTDTAGQVMEFPNGSVASTQYSASTGGYSAPGAFPAVPDTGDSICTSVACNPNHTWTTSIPVSTVEAAWPQLGTLEQVNITARNGYGDWGGRVTAMTLVGSAQNVQLTGDQFTGAMGLKSDWFTVATTQPPTTTTTTPPGTTTTATTTPPTTTVPPPSLTAPAVGMATTPDGRGYWLVGSNGQVVAFGDASFFGSTAAMTLTHPIVGMAATPDGQGYWLVASDGGIFAFGDASFVGSTGGIALNKPIVGMADTPDGQGYWLVASDGGIFAFGDALFHGSTGAMALNKPVVGMAPSPDGRGYWLVASDGGIFAFGDARFHGSTGAIALNKPVVSMAATPDGLGYWLVASDGGIFAFGDARFYGSTGGTALAKPIVGMSATRDAGGYWLVASDGGIFTFGDAGFYGSTG